MSDEASASSAAGFTEEPLKGGAPLPLPPPWRGEPAPAALVMMRLLLERRKEALVARRCSVGRILPVSSKSASMMSSAASMSMSVCAPASGETPMAASAASTCLPTHLIAASKLEALAALRARSSRRSARMRLAAMRRRRMAAVVEPALSAVATTWRIVSSSRRVAKPMLTAVSCLSPVTIQILTPPLASSAMVSGTSGCSLSSLAVAPCSVRPDSTSAMSSSMRLACLALRRCTSPRSAQAAW